MRVEKTSPLPDFPSPPLRVVALAVEEAQFLFAQLGVDDLDADLAERAVAPGVGGAVGQQILRAQLLLNLREGRAEFLPVLREEDAPARPLGDFFERALVYLVPFFVADAD